MEDKTYFITGATGFVGSSLAYRLLRGGHKVIALVRSKISSTSPADVASHLLDRVWNPLIVASNDANFNPEQLVALGQLHLVPGDITIESPLLGLPEKIPLGKIDVVCHVAGKISFSEKDFDSTWEVNVEGTRRVLNFAHTVRAEKYSHISTAYVAGSAEGVFLESERDGGQIFNNCYEFTKAEGENLVAHLCSRFRMPYSIYRPPIVVGGRGGTSLSFDGYYMYFKSFWVIKKIVLRKLKQDPDAFKGSGVKICDDGCLYLPLVARSERRATINLAPIDWFSDTFMEIDSKEISSGQVFHVVHPRPPKVRWLIDRSLDKLGIKGVRHADPDESVDHGNETLNEIQSQLDKGLVEYEPYTGQRHSFSDFNVRAVSNSHYRPPPPIEDQLLADLLGYAMEKDFKSTNNHRKR